MANKHLMHHPAHILERPIAESTSYQQLICYPYPILSDTELQLPTSKQHDWNY